MKTAPVHRVRDLDAPGRVVAAALALALLLPPVVAAAMFVGDWTPAGDPALMALRGLDVGTARTPMIGQPSSSRIYAGGYPAHHPGPLHFYLIAVPIRVLGGAAGMLVVSAAITGTALVTSAWAVFRQLGRAAGMLAAVVLAAVAFTTGASSLVNPVSSSIAGYPLLLSAVLLWCVACGDTRLLPAAAAAVSFTAQQHLSVAIATATVTVGCLALLAVTARREGWRGDPGAARELRRAAAGAGVVCAVLWAPVLAQQVLGDVGNLGQILWFAREGNGDTLGPTAGLWQVVQALSLPPLLGRTDVTGLSFVERPTAIEWATALAVVVAVAWLARRWRSTRPRQALLGAMAGLLALAGVLNGSSVPRGLEEGRLVFFHWAWPLGLFVALVIGLAMIEAARDRLGAARRAPRPLLAGLAVAAVAAPALVNPVLDRRTNTLDAMHTRIERDVVDTLADEVLAHRDDLGDHTVLLVREEPLFAGMSNAVGFRLNERGLDLRYPRDLGPFVAGGRIVDRARVDGAVMIVFDTAVESADPPGGELVAEHRFAEALDAEAHESLVAAARRADEVRHGPAATRALRELGAGQRAYIDAAFGNLLDDPEEALLNPGLVQLLVDFPTTEPAFDDAALADLAATIRSDDAPSGVRALRIFLLDRAETLDLAYTSELGRPRDDDGDNDGDRATAAAPGPRR